MQTYLLFLEDKIPNLTLPAVERRRELGVELARARTIGRALANLQLDEELPGGVATLLQDLLAVDLQSDIISTLHAGLRWRGKEDVRGRRRSPSCRRHRGLLPGERCQT